jgi:hypothetical protein
VRPEIYAECVHPERDETIRIITRGDTADFQRDKRWVQEAPEQRHGRTVIENRSEETPNLRAASTAKSRLVSRARISNGAAA